MREFSDLEKSIIRLIVDAKDRYDPRGLLLDRIVYDHVGAIAIEWDNENHLFFAVVYNAGENGSKLLFRLLDIISLFDYLEREGQILVHQITGIDPDDGLLMDRERYGYDENDPLGSYYTRHNENGQEVRGYTRIEKVEIRTDLGQKVARLNGSLLHPTQELVDLVNKKFKSIEQKRFEKTICWTRITAVISFIGLIIALILPNYTRTRIDKAQINSINQTIKEQSLPDIFDANITNDTLKVEVINTLLQ